MSTVARVFCVRAGIFCLYLLLISVCFAQDGTNCVTPNQESGICISIKDCSPLVNLLKTQGATQEVASFLRNSACGWKGQYPLVCCAQRPNRALDDSFERLESTSPRLENTSPPLLDSNLPREPYCGFNNVSKSRIVNGVPAKLGEYPWIVALGYRNARNPEQPRWLCGGSLISVRHILTAAHCVYNRQDLYLAKLGELDLYSDVDGAQPTTIPISKAKIHENFSPSSYTNDIAILTLSQRNTNPTVYPICLPLDEPMSSNNFVGFSAFVAGWGALYFNGPSSPHLQTAIVPVVTNEQCSRAFVNFRTTTIDQRVICAGVGGMDACQGDSGGPLMYGKPDVSNLRFYQIGLVSYGFRCAEVGYPGVYTRITSFVEWIKNNLE